MNTEIKNSLIEDWTGKFNTKIWEILLFDRTTRKNIIWATNEYTAYGAGYEAKQEITLSVVSGLHGDIIQPRVMKSEQLRQERTKKRAEVFTPSWLCNKQNNFVDDEWFGREHVFNDTDAKRWQATAQAVSFPEKKAWTWKKYVDSRRLELTCGEAPYLASRYDTVTGEPIDVEQRIGMLDRKLRIVNENAADEEEWIKWATRAFQSTYGYEFQGDNLLIARINLLITFIDNLRYRWNREASFVELRTIAHIISWNIWQMDGLVGTVPYGTSEESMQQMNLFEEVSNERALDFVSQPHCRIRDWRWNASLTYRSIKEHDYKGDSKMKFDVVIGNPPYQDENIGDNTKTPPIYNEFLSSSFKVADIVELIHPARFLFNAGDTPKWWNKKMLEDAHLKVIYYEPKSSNIFSNTDIKGGIAITLHDSHKKFGCIGTFTIYSELNSILGKVLYSDFHALSTIVYSPVAFKFTQKMHDLYPNIKNKLSKNNEYEVKTNVFESIPEVFYNEPPEGINQYVKILGREKTIRKVKYIRRDFIANKTNLDNYKVVLSEANGTGVLGEILSSPLIGEPLLGHTQTFLTIGKFDNRVEAENLLKYVKTKFARALLGTLKITQHNSISAWDNVPLQDFTPQSDIDWTKSIHEIDLQLYRKYGLDEKEITFIESKVKEMV